MTEKEQNIYEWGLNCLYTSRYYYTHNSCVGYIGNRCRPIYHALLE